MGRPRRNSNRSDSGSTAGNVYNASVAAAQQQKAIETAAILNVPPILPSPTVSPSVGSSSLTPQLDAISLAVAAEIEKRENASPSNNTSNVSLASTNTNEGSLVQSTTSSAAATPSIHRRSLSIAELVSLVSARNPKANQQQNSALPALNALNLPDALRSTLEKADSPILNALLPLIRQKLADKTSSGRRNSAFDPNGSGSSIEARRSSTSSRSEDHRLSHKLAERKRRKEMKDVFDDLKDVLPPGVPKSSKWEILNEASTAIDDLLAQEQALLNQRNQLLKKINESKNSNNEDSNN